MITFDSLMLKEFSKEEMDFILGARINKIQQPTRREIILSLRNNAKNRQLYVNITPQFYHVCFVSDENLKRRCIDFPQKPPMFCMLLRKYLSNAKIAKVEQPQNERILELYFETYNEIGDKIYLCLALELMGKYSNVILYNTDTNIILGCAHNVGSDKSQKREVCGQIPYIYPPLQSENSFISDRYAFLFSCKREIYPQGRVNNIIDNYYAYLIEKYKYISLKSEYKTKICSKLKKVEKSLKEMEYQSLKSEDSDKYRLYGDLIMANLYNLKDYSDSVNVFDYENNCNITIELKKEKTLKENANNFYKKYNKSKRTTEKLAELMGKDRQEKVYLEQLLYSINSAQDITELKELADEVETDVTELKSDKNFVKPRVIDIEEGSCIYIGKNNKQNDYIISKLAKDDDLWFHTKDCPGSHVLLKTENLTNELILECAKLAKQYSSASNSSKVGVIYTKRKYLRKPPKANLGYVTYKNEKEIIID